jgi:hypothetical protein
MPDCQSGAVHSLGCGTIICVAVAGDFGVCHADCHEGKCRNALYKLVCSGGKSAPLFPEERDGRRLAQGNAYANRSQQGSYKDEPPTLAIDTSINARAASS